MDLVEVKVDTVEEEELLDPNAIVAPVILTFVSLWAVNILTFYRSYGDSQVVLRSVKFSILDNTRQQFKKMKDNRNSISVALGITMSTESEGFIISSVIRASSEGGDS